LPGCEHATSGLKGQGILEKINLGCRVAVELISSRGKNEKIIRLFLNFYLNNFYFRGVRIIRPE